MSQFEIRSPCAAAVALHFVHYNFARIHKTLRITPASPRPRLTFIFVSPHVLGSAHRPRVSVSRDSNGLSAINNVMVVVPPGDSKFGADLILLPSPLQHILTTFVCVDCDDPYIGTKLRSPKGYRQISEIQPLSQM